jgi:hypothetical protein
VAKLPNKLTKPQSKSPAIRKTSGRIFPDLLKPYIARVVTNSSVMNIPTALQSIASMPDDLTRMCRAEGSQIPLDKAVVG